LSTPTSGLRRFGLSAALVAVALAGSGFLYARSRSADFDRHARVLEALGSVRHLSELLSKQVLAARFGLLNQYDPLTSTELSLLDARGELGARIEAAVEVDDSLQTALAQLDQAVQQQRFRVERFKAENSVLRNSVYYLPTAAQDAETSFSEAPATGAARTNETAIAVHQLVRAALVYNVVGDQTARNAHMAAVSRLASVETGASAELRPHLKTVLAHAGVIGQKQPAVDRWVKEVVDSDLRDRLKSLEDAYQGRFGETVVTSNRYRRILYGWSLFLLLAVTAAGLQLKKLYADLERRVADRTVELRTALAALWGEMKLARKIQEALVPTAPILENCEVAVSMKPTEEVGGDYYDVIHTRNNEWILIGDVSGHGVPAGLIMMMCQTAVRTVLRRDPDIMPDRLLSMVNTVLTENIRQLGENKYMTISALRRDPDGRVFFAGAHQDICVYRAASDSVECIETEGLWLGLKDSIDEALVTQSFQLGTGDVLLLYTDGIIEASRDGSLFDVGGVRDVLGRARGKSAQQVLSELFTALRDFKLNDDATVLVIRQLNNSLPAGRVDARRSEAGSVVESH
jgi:serine phosphatase RsbU (regulator of sigma subunit)